MHKMYSQVVVYALVVITVASTIQMVKKTTNMLLFI